MTAFDRILGYHSIKEELTQIADVLIGSDYYTKLGVKLPRGLLLHGKPGVGKTLMATCLVEVSGRNVYSCRKDSPGEGVAKAIREAFEKAKENTPSIVFLDDMDKFSNEDNEHRNTDEYIIIQSCIDQCKDCDVFVVATANDTRYLPQSLLRAGRFDRVIQVNTPSENDAEAIIGHYMADKQVAADVDLKLIARLMNNCSCAQLETVINEAGLRAAYAGSARNLGCSGGGGGRTSVSQGFSLEDCVDLDLLSRSRRTGGSVQFADARWS